MIQKLYYPANLQIIKNAINAVESSEYFTPRSSGLFAAALHGGNSYVRESDTHVGSLVALFHVEVILVADVQKFESAVIYICLLDVCYCTDNFLMFCSSKLTWDTCEAHQCPPRNHA